MASPVKVIINITNFKNIHLCQQGCYNLGVLLPSFVSYSHSTSSFRPSQPRLSTPTSQSGLLNASSFFMNNLPFSQQNIDKITDATVCNNLDQFFVSRSIEIHHKGISEVVLDQLFLTLPQNQPLKLTFFLLFSPSTHDAARQVSLSDFNIVATTELILSIDSLFKYLSPQTCHFQAPVVFLDPTNFVCSYSLTIHLNSPDQQSDEHHFKFIEDLKKSAPGDFILAQKRIVNCFKVFDKIEKFLLSSSGLVETYLSTSSRLFRSQCMKSLLPCYLCPQDNKYLKKHEFLDFFSNTLDDRATFQNFRYIVKETVLPLNSHIFSPSLHPLIFHAKTLLRRPASSSTNQSRVKTRHQIFLLYGLGGSSSDMFFWKSLLNVFLPHVNVVLLKSVTDFSQNLSFLSDLVADELVPHFRQSPKNTVFSFISHSLGSLLIRSALTNPKLASFSHRYATFISPFRTSSWTPVSRVIPS
ncbi:hypothetical protein GEMRC1_007393 [Eukaryota sp. GEM-RC1]